ncbi:putative fatty acyl-CoA reductase CG5065 [Melitaea cinxia]|uniref:putative fatty acyl-CoA reductase CG5065 n=1 Tax=Melitaea cinxia TaxID=113334 RepID=UPI001E27265D|nr:putative fatty acyl-CoA reductase CG5065 [Melitaea cinxia]
MRDIDEINAEALNENAAIKQAILSGDSNVQKFYDNAVVFITGGSGFIGKQLIEKLLRSCNIMKIYVLLRVKKNKTIEERLKALLDDPVYDDLHKEQPNFVHKIVPIEGDIESLKLGIDDESWKTLAEEVSVIIHAAATVNFNEAVKKATLTNVRGAREVLKLAEICKHLK